MSARALPMRRLFVARHDVTVRTAAQLMRLYWTDALVVVNDAGDGRCSALGVLTEHDIVTRAVACEFDLGAVPVEAIMTAYLRPVSERCSRHAALQLMQEQGVARLPVVSARGTLVGMLALEDLLEAGASAAAQR